MSKSKKNTIDPETMINQYGADSVRWFILSDSPPEKDIQWSDTGVASASKFLQKIWNLNTLVLKMDEVKFDDKSESKFISEINKFINKVDISIENFRFNVSVAHFYEMYNFFKNYIGSGVRKKVLSDSLIKIMKLMVPFTPHLASECLELLGCKNVDEWPKIDQKYIINQSKLAIQVDGKTRDIIEVKQNLMEEEINKLVITKSKAKKYLENKKILKTIFVKNKIINYIIEKNEKN